MSVSALRCIYSHLEAWMELSRTEKASQKTKVTHDGRYGVQRAQIYDINLSTKKANKLSVIVQRVEREPGLILLLTVYQFNGGVT